MNFLFKTSIPILLISSYCVAQDPMPVLGAGWERSVQRAASGAVATTGPARSMMPDNKYFQRKAREGRTDMTTDPNDATIEGRSAAMDRAVQEARTPRADDQRGYSYSAQIRNDSGKTVEVIFWEYRFSEIARPTNIVRRQFLCGIKIKKGETKQLNVFSLLGPSDSIDMESLAKPTEKLFNEEVLINRIELTDGSILQRADWKYADVKEAVVRATAIPWEKESCRAL